MIPDSRIWRTIGAGARHVATWPFRVAAARATLKALANMDRRELADIGLNASDVRDASALPLDRDPTALLATRARRKRSSVGSRSSGNAEASRTSLALRPMSASSRRSMLASAFSVARAAATRNGQAAACLAPAPIVRHIRLSGIMGSCPFLP